MHYEKILQELLWRFGVNKRYQGFDNIVYGLELLLDGQVHLEYVTKDLYPDIAKKFGTSWKCVERNIRTVIRTIWMYGNRDLLEELNGSHMKSKPRATEFFDILIEYVKVNYDEDEA